MEKKTEITSTMGLRCVYITRCVDNAGSWCVCDKPARYILDTGSYCRDHFDKIIDCEVCENARREHEKEVLNKIGKKVN